MAKHTGPDRRSPHPAWHPDHRIVIEAVYPEIDGGRYPVKRVVGDTLEVWADIFRDGHDVIRAELRHRGPDGTWRTAAMTHVDNDRWSGRLALTEIGRQAYTIDAWTDAFASWRRDALKKRAAGQELAGDIFDAEAIVARAARTAARGDKPAFARLRALLAETADMAARADLLLGDDIAVLMARAPLRSDSTRYHRTLEIMVDREAARYAAWYEMFPRSQGTDPARGSTFDDCIRRLPYVQALGFDVLYFVPIHPIGKLNRKGRNNAVTAQPGEPGSPYAIGSDEGDHTAVNPELGTAEDFRRLVAAAHAHGLEIALDFAIQCAPDHPWIKQHPEWFSFRPDGSIKYAENPPKKYQDIVNVNFYGPQREAIWAALRDIVLHWVGEGVKIFRVDNPHTKPVPFWEWMIREVQAQHPDVIFLSEAFTRPKMMKALAKAGFTQSYTYFTWRNHKQELIDYLTELTRSECREYLRPNFFANTPDILPRILQNGGRAAFQTRLVLAATLSSVYGIYNGFELCEAAAVPNTEEYADSEKYQFKVWDWDRPGNIKDYIARVNAIRRANPALHHLTNLRFYPASSDQILFYGKMSEDRTNIVFVAVNLDPFNAHEATIEFPMAELGVSDDATLQIAELLGDDNQEYPWHGARHGIRLDPQRNPAALYRVRTAAAAANSSRA